MAEVVEANGLSLNSRARYTVRLHGVLDPSWAERLGGMQIITQGADGTGSSPVTTLTGDVADQAALSGILNTVYMLGLPLLSVEFLGDPKSNKRSDPLLD